MQSLIIAGDPFCEGGGVAVGCCRAGSANWLGQKYMLEKLKFMAATLAQVFSRIGSLE